MNINSLYWTEYIFFLFGEFFGHLDVLKSYAAEHIVISTWELCIREFNE